MSFSRDVKIELCQKELPECCKKAFISAIIKMNSSLGISNQGMSINISFENVTIIRYVYEALKEMYQIKTQIVVSKQMGLKKNNVYTLKIVDKAIDILNDLKLMDNFEIRSDIAFEYISKQCCRRATIAGCFVAAGSVNSPQKANYHLEIQSNDKQYLENLLRVIEHVNKGTVGICVIPWCACVNCCIINARKIPRINVKVFAVFAIVRHFHYLP